MELHITCDVRTTGSSSTTCQLFVGHESDHAAVVLVGAEKMLRRWDNDLHITDSDFTADAASSLAWAPGYPSLITHEPTEQSPDLAQERSRLSVIAENRAVIQTAKTADLHIA